MTLQNVVFMVLDGVTSQGIPGASVTVDGATKICNSNGQTTFSVMEGPDIHIIRLSATGYLNEEVDTSIAEGVQSSGYELLRLTQCGGVQLQVSGGGDVGFDPSLWGDYTLQNGVYYFYAGVQTQWAATPHSGWHLDHWIVDGVQTSDPTLSLSPLAGQIIQLQTVFAQDVVEAGFPWWLLILLGLGLWSASGKKKK